MDVRRAQKKSRVHFSDIISTSSSLENERPIPAAAAMLWMQNVGAFKIFHYTQETWHSNSSNFYIPVTIYIRPLVYTNGIVQNMGASRRGRQYNDAAFLWLLCMKLQQLSIAFRFPQSAISVYKAISISEKQLGL